MIVSSGGVAVVNEDILVFWLPEDLPNFGSLLHEPCQRLGVVRVAACDLVADVLALSHLVDIGIEWVLAKQLLHEHHGLGRIAGDLIGLLDDGIEESPDSVTLITSPIIFLLEIYQQPTAYRPEPVCDAPKSHATPEPLCL